MIAEKFPVLAKRLAETEKAELTILEAYLPAQMSREEVFAYVKDKAAGGFDKEKNPRAVWHCFRRRGGGDWLILRDLSTFSL